jgi:nucleoside-diphosphate-sugar epimerase
MTKILITGANSFVGQNFIKNTEFKEVKEICLIKNKVEEIDFSGFDVVLHVAAIVHQTTKISEQEYFRINKDLALAVARRAKQCGIKQFIFLSTIKVYGALKPGNGIWNEESECFPNDSYGRSKYAAELALKDLIDENFTVSIIRPPLIYGVGVKANMLNIIKLIDKFPILPLGGIDNRRSFTSIENLVQLIDTTIKEKISGIFLAMDEEPMSTTKLAEIIAKHLNKKVKFITLPKVVLNIGKTLAPGIFDRLYGSLEINNSLTRKALNYIPKLSIDYGIKKMVEAYLIEKSR